MAPSRPFESYLGGDVLMKFKKQHVWIVLACLVPVVPVQARMITQITPTLTITEEFNDNYFSTDSNKKEEWTTTYELGFSVGFLNKKSRVYLGYNPAYEDYNTMDDRDSLDHNFSLNADFQPTKHTSIAADLGYDGHDGNNDGDSWEHTAAVTLDSQLTETLGIHLSQDYANSFDEQVRTGDYKEHQTNTTRAGITKKFGEKNSMGMDVTYEFDDYKNSDQDEYTSWEPSAFVKYWFTRLDGIESHLEYENKEFESFSDSDYETTSGDIRYIRRFSRHFDGYIKYRHYLSDRSDGNHEIYHPSVGFDWDIDEDSGISIGFGVQFHEWDNENDDSTNPFIDIDVYKIFNFSRRGSLALTGSSGYDEGDEDAGSLGYNIYYQAGLSLDYQLMKRMSSSLYGSYKLQDFSEDDVDRRDQTLEVGGGLTWSPFKWMQLSLRATHTNFRSDDDRREDYEENVITFFVRLIPEKPIRPDKMPSRKSLEKTLFN